MKTESLHTNYDIKLEGQIQKAANKTLGNGVQPFFIAAGLHKPHVPFYAPAEYYKLYSDSVMVWLENDMAMIRWFE